MVGAGLHIGLTIFLLLAAVLLEAISVTKKGEILTGLIVLFCLSSFFGTFMASKLYKYLKGEFWIRNILTTIFLFPLPFSLVFLAVNSMAWYNGLTAALPFSAILTIVALFTFVSLPLSIIGGILGKNSIKRRKPSDLSQKQDEFEFYNPPCAVHQVPRQIPTTFASDSGGNNSSQKQGYFISCLSPSSPSSQRLLHFLLAGFLPFSAIYIELHYIFSSIWGHTIYTLFGILMLTFILLLIVTSFITISLLYFQLNREDYRWWFRTFVNGGATGLFILGYSVFFYTSRSSMEGSYSLLSYFGYVSMISLSFFLFLGAVSFLSCFYFVHHIYKVIKLD
jgi:hypothetical protein